MPSTFTPRALFSLLGTLGLVAALGAAAITYAFGLQYVTETTSPVLQEDAWWFVEVWLIPWQDGTLELADLWAKRHGNHAQPIAALLFLGNAAWLGLDFAAETRLALAIATLYAVLLSWIAFRFGPAGDRRRALAFAAACVCVVFSVNSTDKLSWSLVGLFYIGHCLGAGLLLAAAQLRSRARPILLFALALAVCALIDTGGILWCAAALGVLLVTRPEQGGATLAGRMQLALALVFAVVTYLALYQLLAPAQAGPSPIGLQAALAALRNQDGSFWTLVMPAGSALAHPGRLAQQLGPGEHSRIVLCLAAMCALSHAWLWSTALRHPTNGGFAVACGLALFSYATIFGILVQRVPEFGFDYFWQTRYGVFFDLLWLAPLLGLACRPQAEDGRIATGLFVACVILPVGLAQLWIDDARNETADIRAWNLDLAQDTLALLADPDQVPADCHPFLDPCGWPPEARRRLLAALRAGPYNVASPAFRAAHGLPDPPAAPVSEAPPRAAASNQPAGRRTSVR